MTPMTPTEDIRAARHRLAAQFNNDLDRIGEDLQRQQRESGYTYITLTRYPRTPADTTNQSMRPTGMGGREGRKEESRR